MANIISTDNPVIDRLGRKVGNDTVTRPETPPDPSTLPAISAGAVRVTCSCKRIYDNVPQAKWDSWPQAPRQANGVCGCVSHFS